MSKTLIAVPKGYKFIELSYPDSWKNFIKSIKITPIKNLPNGAEIKTVILDEFVNLKKEK